VRVSAFECIQGSFRCSQNSFECIQVSFERIQESCPKGVSLRVYIGLFSVYTDPSFKSILF